jgi:hypothetical protein
LHDFPLPAPSATWIWLLAPPGEKHRNAVESRRVEAFVFSSGRLKPNSAELTTTDQREIDCRRQLRRSERSESKDTESTEGE